MAIKCLTSRCHMIQNCIRDIVHRYLLNRTIQPVNVDENSKRMMKLTKKKKGENKKKSKLLTTENRCFELP